VPVERVEYTMWPVDGACGLDHARSHGHGALRSAMTQSWMNLGRVGSAW
jgi:hypothetical protein